MVVVLLTTVRSSPYVLLAKSTRTLWSLMVPGGVRHAVPVTKDKSIYLDPKSFD